MLETSVLVKSLPTSGTPSATGETISFPIPDSRFPIPDSQFPIPNSQFPIPNSQFPIPNSQFPIAFKYICSIK
ncbi:MAG: hypothetical protein F6K41_06875 [Symploca sp. SIO3E6]|nr:hypothetical protein [Caldora sp. SIO3E6]